jgi:hypothetical protein
MPRDTAPRRSFHRGTCHTGSGRFFGVRQVTLRGWPSTCARRLQSNRPASEARAENASAKEKLAEFAIALPLDQLLADDQQRRDFLDGDVLLAIDGTLADDRGLRDLVVAFEFLRAGHHLTRQFVKGPAVDPDIRLAARTGWFHLIRFAEELLHLRNRHAFLQLNSRGAASFDFNGTDGTRGGGGATREKQSGRDYSGKRNQKRGTSVGTHGGETLTCQTLCWSKSRDDIEPWGVSLPVAPDGEIQAAPDACGPHIPPNEAQLCTRGPASRVNRDQESRNLRRPKDAEKPESDCCRGDATQRASRRGKTAPIRVRCAWPPRVRHWGASLRPSNRSWKVSWQNSNHGAQSSCPL